jgi:hypothetical protein
MDHDNVLGVGAQQGRRRMDVAYASVRVEMEWHDWLGHGRWGWEAVVVGCADASDDHSGSRGA